MNFEAVELVSQRHYAEGLGYLATTYASTIGAAALGFTLTTFLAS
jgi:fluoride ion exporter CrcB/FEX